MTDLKLLMTAILSEKIVKMTYSQYEIKEIELQIYEIFYRNGLWICSAYDINQEKWELIVVITCQRSKSLMMGVKLKTI